MTTRMGVLFLVAACGGGGGSVDVTAKVLNGATPTSAPRLGVLPAVPQNGNWALSPNKMKLKLTRVSLSESGNGTGTGTNADLTDCEIPYDLASQSLATLVECPLTLQPGTYRGFSISFDATYEVLIDDATNGFFSDPAAPSKISTTPPAGGAQFVSIMTPSSGNTFGATAALPEPLTIADGDAVTLSIVVNGLQFIRVSVSGGTVSLGNFGNGDPFRPDMTASFGDVARVSYYVQEAIGHANSRYNGGDVGSPPPPGGITSVNVFYSAPTSPSLLFIGLNGTPMTCGPFGSAGAIAAPSGDGYGGYLGRDTTGTLGWAFPTDNMWSSISTELAMAEKQNLGETTTLLCRKVTSDPMPAGGTYASGAPMIASPDYSVTMMLVAR
jgi:hypothetical protein